MKLPETKVEKLRLTANILLFFGTVLTTNYVLSANDYQWFIWPIVFLICSAVQYVVTNIESAIFSGSIPSPWSDKRSTKTNWIWFGATIILLMDVIVNLGGVGIIANFIKDSASGDVLKDSFGTTPFGLQVVTGFFIVALALLVAIGPELARMYAETLEPTPAFGESPSRPLTRPMITEPPVIVDDPIQLALANARRNNSFDLPTRSIK